MTADTIQRKFFEHGPCDYSGGPGSDQCPHGVFFAPFRVDPDCLRCQAMARGDIAGGSYHDHAYASPRTADLSLIEKP